MMLASQCPDELTGTQGRSHTCIQQYHKVTNSLLTTSQILQTITKEAMSHLICMLYGSFNHIFNSPDYVTADDRIGK
jgi:hypothetical protein